MKGPDAARPTLERAVGNGCPRRADPLPLAGLDRMKVRAKSAAVGRRQKFIASRPASASTILVHIPLAL